MAHRTAVLHLFLATAWRSSAAPQCSVVSNATWTYLPASAFNHSVTKQGLPQGWNNFQCSYEWHAAGDADVSFESPTGCLTDRWLTASGHVITRAAGDPVYQEIELTFTSATGNRKRTAGNVSDDCTLIDMADGGLFIRGVHPIDQSGHEWLRTTTAWLMRAAQIRFPDGSLHLTPGYPTHYNGQWMRDGYYGISNAWDVASAAQREHFFQSFEWMLSRARPDGILPQQCPPTGPCSYGNEVCNDTVGVPGWQDCQDLDTASFAIKLAAHFWASLPAKRAATLYGRWNATLRRSLDGTRVRADGLLWSNPDAPIIGYGFQDAEIKSGGVLYSSVLAWNASRLLAAMADAAGDVRSAASLRDRARAIKKAADSSLWDDSLGIYRASTGVESNVVDLWANAAAGAMGFADAGQAGRIFAYFRDHEDEIFYEGQVR